MNRPQSSTSFQNTSECKSVWFNTLYLHLKVKHHGIFIWPNSAYPDISEFHRKAGEIGLGIWSNNWWSSLISLQAACNPTSFAESPMCLLNGYVGIRIWRLIPFSMDFIVHGNAFLNRLSIASSLVSGNRLWAVIVEFVLAFCFSFFRKPSGV